ncbi:PTS system mannose/fructose/sorbose family transporter subunit IID [Clostridium neuense]|uniref:PTS system mannose/fructose/sorbose family transporter subunit IID n=1 Tax=Clostridium neuense TaxID=1728934 RepID=A0ABW8TIM1_9CLOT
MTSDKKITKKDLIKVFFRSLSMEWAWNYERQQNLGYCYSMIPIIRKLYDKAEDRAQALKRHLEFINTTPHVSTLLLGISSAMEETNATTENFDTDSISTVKVGLMGPIAGIGDSFIWGTLRIIATGIGTSLALQGNILGPILFLLVFNVPHYLIRYFCMMTGYKLGSGFLSKLQKSGMMDGLTYGASILALMVIGGMISSFVTLKIPLKIGTGKTAVSIESIINGIIPNVLPLLFTALLYWMLKKGLKTTHILAIIAVLGIVGAYFGFLGA